MKKIFPFLYALVLTVPLAGQVKFNLTYEPVSQVYTVGIIPGTTWAAPQNRVPSAQVTLRVEAGADFSPVITSLIPGLSWVDNAYVESPVGAPGYTFVSVALANGPTDKILFTENQETLLFSFTNAGGACPGPIELLSNDDAMVQAVRAGGYNVTQHLAVLGAGRNSFTGLENGSADCTTSATQTPPAIPLVSEVQIAPVPADIEVQVRWNALQAGAFDLIVYDSRGREVHRERTDGKTGPHQLSIPVKNWQAGVYALRMLQHDSGRQTQAWNLMVIH